jgi:hypothetical protein
MASNHLLGQLIRYLTGAHSIQDQALVQMGRVPNVAAKPAIALSREHLRHPEAHHQVRQRLVARGAAPSRFKGVAVRVTGKGPLCTALDIARSEQGVGARS